MTVNREIHLKCRPQGSLCDDNFALITCGLVGPVEGQVLIRNLWMSVDPYMRPRMEDSDSYIAPFQIGEALDGDAVGRVLSSRHPDYSEGDLVLNFGGWRDHHLSDGSDLQKIEADANLDANEVPLQLYLGLLGMTGHTAYFGLLDVAALQPGETVFVSAAAGAVGSTVCQIAKLKGCRVIGSCGSDDKARWLSEALGVDAVVNYKTAANLTQALSVAAPEGIDVYFENVGGTHLEAALACMNDFGRIAVCGTIQDYNSADPSYGPRNLSEITTKRLRMEGFIVSDFADRFMQSAADLTQWYREGKLKSNETVLVGIEEAPRALIGLFNGTNTGKMLVNLAQNMPSK